MKKILILITFCFPFYGFSQRGTYVDDSVTVLKLRNSALIAKLDSFMAFERRCEYFTPKLIIGVHIQTWEDGYFITIGSDFGLGVVKDRRVIYGGLIFNEHYLEIRVNVDVDDSIKNNFFEKTDEVLFVKRYVPFNGYDPESGVLILESYEDDSFSFWRYFYHEDVFNLIARHTYCE